MTDPLQNLQPSHREQIANALFQLRGDLADGLFLRESLYTCDESRFAGNTHHYWIRLGLDPNPQKFLRGVVSEALPNPLAQWLTSHLDRKIIQRLPREYSTLVKIPFSVELGRVADERTEQTERAIAHGLPAMTPYAIFHLEINRLLRAIGSANRPVTASEFGPLFANYNKNAIVKARNRFPEVWDELRGHYVLDSRGTHFAKSLVTELSDRRLMTSSSKFVDVGSGIGTNVLAANYYSHAHATGIERHPGLVQISNAMMRRLDRLGLLDSQRLELVLGDAFDSQVANLGQYDIFYVYSPLGMWEIDIDMIVDSAQVGAVIVCNRLPIRNREIVTSLENVAGLYAFRKIAEMARD